MTPYAREEQKGEKRSMAIQTTTNHHGKTRSFKIALVILLVDRSFVFRLTGSLHTAIFADTIVARYLRIPPGHDANIGEKATLFKDRESPKTHTLSRGTYLYSPNRGVHSRGIIKLYSW